jgi:hypothetical protein
MARIEVRMSILLLLPPPHKRGEILKVSLDHREEEGS